MEEWIVVKVQVFSLFFVSFCILWIHVCISALLYKIPGQCFLVVSCMVTGGSWCVNWMGSWRAVCILCVRSINCNAKRFHLSMFWSTFCYRIDEKGWLSGKVCVLIIIIYILKQNKKPFTYDIHMSGEKNLA